jgi:hypothetical protein
MQDFAYPNVQAAVDNALLYLQEGGVLEDIKSLHQPPTPTCLASTEFHETNQVQARFPSPCWKYAQPLGAFQRPWVSRV